MTADPRPAPPEHADRDALAEILREGHRHAATYEGIAYAILAWMKLEGFARTPESASGTDSPLIGYIPSGCVLPEELLETLWHEFLKVATAWIPRVGMPLDFARSVESAAIAAPPPSVGAVPANELTGFEKGALDPDAITAARKWLRAAERSDRYWHREHTTIKCALDRAAYAAHATQPETK